MGNVPVQTGDRYFVLLFWDGLSRPDWAKRFPTTRTCIHNVLHNHRCRFGFVARGWMRRIGLAKMTALRESNTDNCQVCSSGSPPLPPFSFSASCRLNFISAVPNEMLVDVPRTDRPFSLMSGLHSPSLLETHEWQDDNLLANLSSLGSNLSQGQRQLVSLARAMLAPSNILGAR